MGVWIETGKEHHQKIKCYVTPFVGVWIETALRITDKRKRYVTPFVGVWIETHRGYEYNSLPWSHPSWVCGLKLF